MPSCADCPVCGNPDIPPAGRQWDRCAECGHVACPGKIRIKPDVPDWVKAVAKEGHDA